MLYTPQTPVSTLSSEVPVPRIVRTSLSPGIGPYLEIRIFSVLPRRESAFSITGAGSVKAVTKLCSLPVACMYHEEEFRLFTFSGAGEWLQCLGVRAGLWAMLLLFPTVGHLAGRTELSVRPEREVPNEGKDLATGKRQPLSGTVHNAQKTIPKYGHGFELPREYKRIQG